MNLSRTSRLLLLVMLTLCASAGAAERAVDRATMQKLSALHGNEGLRLDAFPVGPQHNAALRFERVQIYAKDAPLYVITASGKQQLPRSERIFLRARSDDGSTRVAMSLNADGSFAEGNGIGPDGSFALEAHADANGTHAFSARTLESTLPSPDAFEFKCGNESVQLDIHSVTHTPDLATELRNATSGATAPASNAIVPVGAPQATQAFRLAVIAIDTDSLFMSRLFSNNTTNATNWIASMFNTMNTMYEADLNVQLLIGTTILRTSSAGDPYTGLSSGGASGADLNLFGNYWRLNETGVSRSFAILLSGAIASSGGGCSAAGIAWIDQYCQKGFVGNGGADTIGSYSVNKVCTSLGVDPNGVFDAHIVGHEIGHNFGASHTHCTNISTGASDVATNTIDQCYNGEGASHTTGGQCYDGPTSCPAGQSAGTIMSYCNVSGCGTQNQLHFHPTHINSVLLPAIAANASCLDLIFQDKFGG